MPQRTRTSSRMFMGKGMVRCKTSAWQRVFAVARVAAPLGPADKTTRTSITRIATAPIAAGPCVIDIRHAARVTEAVGKRFMRSGNDFPARMRSIGTAQSAFAGAAIERSSPASV